jgi:hypothetical protein
MQDGDVPSTCCRYQPVRAAVGFPDTSIGCFNSYIKYAKLNELHRLGNHQC